MRQKLMLIAILGIVLLSITAPAFAQETAAPSTPGSIEYHKWSVIAGAFSLGFAAAICGLSQGLSIIAACKGIARNPGASGQIRFVLIFGLVLIESLAIYVLLINLIIFFVNWNKF